MFLLLLLGFLRSSYKNFLLTVSVVVVINLIYKSPCFYSNTSGMKFIELFLNQTWKVRYFAIKIELSPYQIFFLIFYSILQIASTKIYRIFNIGVLRDISKHKIPSNNIMNINRFWKKFIF